MSEGELLDNVPSTSSDQLGSSTVISASHLTDVVSSPQRNYYIHQGMAGESLCDHDPDLLGFSKISCFFQGQKLILRMPPKSVITCNNLSKESQRSNSIKLKQ